MNDIGFGVVLNWRVDAIPFLLPSEWPKLQSGDIWTVSRETDESCWTSALIMTAASGGEIKLEMIYDSVVWGCFLLKVLSIYEKDKTMRIGLHISNEINSSGCQHLGRSCCEWHSPVKRVPSTGYVWPTAFTTAVTTGQSVYGVWLITR